MSLGFIGQTAFGDLELGECTFVISVAVVIRKTESQMRFRKIRLQSQCFVGGGPRFFTPCWQRVEAVICPAFDHREAGESGREVWVELRCLFEKLLSFQRSVAKHI